MDLAEAKKARLKDQVVQLREDSASINDQYCADLVSRDSITGDSIREVKTLIYFNQ